MKVAIVLGTRPEIIKLSSIIRFLEKENRDYYIIHTNQHYSTELDKIFFDEMALPMPKYNLHVGSGTQAEQLGKMFKGIEEVFSKELPDLVIVQGDTNSVFAGAFIASRFGIKIAHVEAGLRSYDLKMPEEINRIITDSICNFYFCPTETQRKILLEENKNPGDIFVVGNSIADAVSWAKENPTNILDTYRLKERAYLLLTLHRAENVDNKERLSYLLNQISLLENETVLFPIHPRTKSKLNLFELVLPKNIICVPPVGFLDMITLEKNSKLILTDSGGIQEEACILNKPCITLRTTTERPETIEVGGNKLMTEDLKKDFEEMCNRRIVWTNPLGDGRTGEKIIRILYKEKCAE